MFECNERLRRFTYAYDIHINLYTFARTYILFKRKKSKNMKRVIEIQERNICKNKKSFF